MVEVSVVMPAHNAAATLAGAIASVQAQTLTDWELLLVDDASTDATWTQAVAAAERDDRIRPLRLSDCAGSAEGAAGDRIDPGQMSAPLGPAAARNAALAQAQGRFVAFLDADDLWLPDKLTRQVALHRSTSAILTYTAYHRCDWSLSGGLATWQDQGRVVSVPPSRTYAQLTWRNVIGCLTAMFDRDQAPAARMPNVPGAEDFGLWLDLLRGGEVGLGLTEPLAIYRAGNPTSMTASRRRSIKSLWQLLHQIEHIPTPPAAARLLTHTLGAIRTNRI